jgi:hypothetical protein
MTSKTSSKTSSERLGKTAAGAPRWLWPAMIGVFLVSRVMAALVGVRFDDSGLTPFWQHLDVELLRHDLAQSVWHLHSQPPLFNVFLGAVLKTGAGGEYGAFATIFHLLGLATYLGTYALMRGMGVRWVWAAAGSTAMMLSPSFILYENWLFYDLPVLAILLAAALAVLRYEQSGGVRWLAVFFAALVAACLTRSLFHLFYMVVIGAGIVWAAAGRRRIVTLVALAAVLVVGGWYVRGYMMFGKFGSTTWLGMHMARVGRQTLTPEELKRLHEEGVISEVSVVEPFSALDKYPTRYGDVGRFKEIPALTRPTKSGRGAPNFNHIGYISLADAYGRDNWALLRARPWSFIAAEAKAWYHYFRPAGMDAHMDDGRTQLGWYQKIWHSVIFGRVALPYHVKGKQMEMYPFLLAGTVAAGCFGVWWSWRGRHASSGPFGSSAFAAAKAPGVNIYILGTVLYVTFIGNVLESGENFRYRFYINSFLLTWLIMFGQGAVDWARSRRTESV